MSSPVRTMPDFTADERTSLEQYLDYQRATVHLKCAGLDPALARRAPLPSQQVTVAGLVSHLTWVERFWFGEVLARREIGAPWTDQDPDADWKPDASRGLDDILAEYAAACDESRADVRDLAVDVRRPFRDGEVTVRTVYLHAIEETARHLGHLDAVRELLDGVTGE